VTVIAADMHATTSLTRRPVERRNKLLMCDLNVTKIVAFSVRVCMQVRPGQCVSV